jgi:hypothetical protein
MFGRRHEELERELRARITLLERCLDEQADREHAIHVELEKMRARYLETEKRADLAQNNFEWARVRLNQIEEERATLIATLIKAPIGALEIQRRLTPEQGEGLPHVPDGLFDDVGDDVAQALGLSADEVTHA